MIRISTLAVLLACGTTRHAASPSAAPTAPARPQPAESDGLQVRSAEDDHPIDATFDQESRGGNPIWTPPPEVVARIRFAVDSLAPSVRRCFAGRNAPVAAVRLIVTRGGRADEVVVESEDPELRACLTGVMHRARFPILRRDWRVNFIVRP